MTPQDAEDTFTQLRALLAGYSQNLVCVKDLADEYYLNTPHIMKNKQPLYFGSVKINKSYVSYHLMPVYVNPALLQDLSAPLRRRMQGKSCFNFKRVDEALLRELGELTRRGYGFYEAEGYLSGRDG